MDPFTRPSRMSPYTKPNHDKKIRHGLNMRRARGLCVHCGEPAESGSSQCKSCYERSIAAGRKRKGIPNRLFNCPICNSPHTKYGWCDLHRPKGMSNEGCYQQARLLRNRKQHRCIVCGGKLDPESPSYCEAHYDKAHQYMDISIHRLACRIIDHAAKLATERNDQESIFTDKEFIRKKLGFDCFMEE